MTDWYERRNELEPGQVFTTAYNAIVRLDRRVPGDGTRWYADTWRKGYVIPGQRPVSGGWSGEDYTVEPGDLIERLTDNYAGELVAKAEARS